MYVCICCGHTDKQIISAAEAGVNSLRELYRYLGGKPQCGKCFEISRQLMDQVHSTPARSIAASNEVIRGVNFVNGERQDHAAA